MKNIKKKATFYIEDYSYGGGVKYLCDIVDVSRCKFDRVIVYCNNSLVSELKKHMDGSSCEVKGIPVLSRAGLRNRLRFIPRKLRALPLLGASALKPIMQGWNALCFGYVLLRERPSISWSANGGFPGSSTANLFTLISHCLSIQTYLSIVSVPLSRKYGFFSKLSDYLTWEACDHVIVNTALALKDLVAERSAIAGKINIVYNSIKDVQCKGERNRDLNEIVLTTISRMVKGKGVFFLLNSFLQLSRKHKNIKLVLIGEGELDGSISDFIRTNNLLDRIEQRGFIENSQMASNIFNSNIFICPSLYEGLPYVILEAMQSGCAIVSTDVGGIGEVLSDHHDSVLIKPGDSNEITAAIDFFLNNPSSMLSYGENARTIFRQKYSYDRFSGRVSSLIDGLQP